MRLAAIGLDIAENVFQVHGADDCGRTVVQRRLRRAQVLQFFAELEPCLVGIEACATSHHWARELSALGHDVRLLPPQYVKPFVKRNKTDAADAEAICEAVTRPTMRFVPIKTKDQQALIMLHRSRDLLIRQRTNIAMALRGHLAELGLVAPKGMANTPQLIALMQSAGGIPELIREVAEILYQQLLDLDARIQVLESRILKWHRSSEVSRRLAEVPGIGPIIATAMIARVGDPHAFKSGRQFSAWLGLVPRQHSSGGKERLCGISKRGNPYLRRLLVVGTRSTMRWSRARPATANPWVLKLMGSKPSNVAAVAVANKTARIVWALMASGEKYKARVPMSA